MQQRLEENDDDGDDWRVSHEYKSHDPWGGRRRRRRRRRWFRRTVNKVKTFVNKHKKKIVDLAKKYHKCCTIGRCKRKPYCYTEWFKKKQDSESTKSGHSENEKNEDEFLQKESENEDEIIENVAEKDADNRNVVDNTFDLIHSDDNEIQDITEEQREALRNLKKGTCC